MHTILLIEDNPDIRENMGEILEMAGYRVLLAPDGKAGAKTAQESLPDLIVCDIMMPELDGYGVLHLLQKSADTAAIPFIFLTAKAERAEMRRGMELGADDYITKPFSGTELLAAIESRLKKSEAAKAAAPAPALAPLVSLVEGSGSGELAQVFAEGKDGASYSKKGIIYKEGGRAHKLFLVESGRIKVWKSNDDGKELITTICGPGDYFGYTALLEGGPYTETAEALEPAEVSSISKDAFEGLMHRNPDVMRQFIKLLAGSVRAKEDQLLGLAYHSLRKKVAVALTALHAKYSAGPEGGEEAGIRISRENLAAVAGTAKESLIRTLADFRDEGLIRVQDSDIFILQFARLRALLN